MHTFCNVHSESQFNPSMIGLRTWEECTFNVDAGYIWPPYKGFLHVFLRGQYLVVMGEYLNFWFGMLLGEDKKCDERQEHTSRGKGGKEAGISMDLSEGPNKSKYKN